MTTEWEFNPTPGIRFDEEADALIIEPGTDVELLLAPASDGRSVGAVIIAVTSGPRGERIETSYTASRVLIRPT